MKQKAKYDAWYKEDSLLNYSKSLFKQDFTLGTPECKYGIWEQAQFSCGRHNDNPAPIIVKDTWSDEILATSSKGLHLKQ
jgi:hypothetical protein